MRVRTADVVMRADLGATKAGEEAFRLIGSGWPEAKFMDANFWWSVSYPLSDFIMSRLLPIKLFPNASHHGAQACPVAALVGVPAHHSLTLRCLWSCRP